MSRTFKIFLRLLAIYLVVAGALYFWAYIESRSGVEFAGLFQGIIFDLWVVIFPIVAIIFVSLEVLIRYTKGQKNKANSQPKKFQE